MFKGMTLMMVAAGALVVGAAIAFRSNAQPAEQLEVLACAHFPAQASSAYRPGVPPLKWRTDLPAGIVARVHPWQQIDFQTDWRNYMAAVLSELQAAGLEIQNNTITMSPGAEWWIAPWMNYGPNGREALLGLTKERGPDPGDLWPQSPGDSQVWAIGFYNREGAKALRDVFLDPCNPARPQAGWTFPAGTVSFKLLFTDADIPYLAGAPVVEAYIDPAGSSSTPSTTVADRVKRQLRLLQLDIAVRDPRAPLGWLFGTYVWQNNQSGLFGDLTPVGLMWGNDPGAVASPLNDFAELPSTRLNTELAGILWQGDEPWPERPWPGFQGRLNGPADNLRSSCLSCHALAQWPRSRELSIVPRPAARYTVAALADPARRDELRTKWMRDVPGGQLMDPAEANPGQNWGGATPLDYSLQLEASFSRMCAACKDGKLIGPTPAVCRVAGARPQVTSPDCTTNLSPSAFMATQTSAERTPPRQ